MKFIRINNLFIISLMLIMSQALFAELKIDFIAPADSEGKGGDGESAEQPVPKSDILQFRNGDQLHGKMLSVGDKGVLWSSLEAEGKITFRTENIKDILLGYQKFYTNNINVKVILTNGDTLAGKLIELNEKELLMDTAYAGELKIDKYMVEAIYPGSSGGSGLYRGPKSLTEWVLPDNRGSDSTVSVKDGVLSLSGYTAVGRDMKLPDVSKVEFDMEALGNCQFQVQIYGNKVRRNPSSGYVVYISSGYVYLQRYDDGDSDNMGNVRSRELQSGKGKITILSNKKEKKIALMINGKMVKQWSDSSWAGNGSFVSFISQSNSMVKIKNIVAGKWNGKIPGGESEGDGIVKKDTISFINDDVVSGTLKSISKGNVVFKTEYAEMNIPLKRIKAIITATALRHRARRRATDIKCIFANGEFITLSLKKISAGVIEGKSGNFGESKMKLDAFSTLQFNIYDEEDE